MENYICLTIQIPENEQDNLVYFLSEKNAEGFEQSSEELKIYFKESEFSIKEIQTFIENYSYQIETIFPTNWNETWESNFPMVTIEGICEIYASHHHPNLNQPYSIHIQPQMSFGTGHHFTTQLMIKLIHEVNLENKIILDMGAGTGILGIFALLKNALKVTFIDIEDWAVENIKENLLLNNLPNQMAICGDHNSIDGIFDVIFANINKNILLQHSSIYYQHLKNQGDLFLSGFFDFDEESILDTYLPLGFSLLKRYESNGWIALHLIKL